MKPKEEEDACEVNPKRPGDENTSMRDISGDEGAKSRDQIGDKEKPDKDIEEKEKDNQNEDLEDIERRKEAHGRQG